MFRRGIHLDPFLCHLWAWLLLAEEQKLKTLAIYRGIAPTKFVTNIILPPQKFKLVRRSWSLARPLAAELGQHMVYR